MFSRTAQLFAALCRACFIYPDKVTMLAFDSLNPEKSDREPSFFKNSCVRFIIDEEVDWGSSRKRCGGQRGRQVKLWRRGARQNLLNRLFIRFIISDRAHSSALNSCTLRTGRPCTATSGTNSIRMPSPHTWSATSQTVSSAVPARRF
jgi:hypothetical protein